MKMIFILLLKYIHIYIIVVKYIDSSSAIMQRNSSKTIGNYILEQEIGSGMFGTVFKCKCINTGEVKACKVIKR